MSIDEEPWTDGIPDDEYPPDPGWAPSSSPAPPTGEEEGDAFEALLQMTEALAARQLEQQDTLDALRETVEEQKKQLDSLTDDLGAAPDGPWAWAALRGAEREKLWVQLFAWVAWLEDRYLRHLSQARPGIPALHADWYRHPVAVELLTSLMVAHIAAYRKRAAPPSFALVDWHERALWPTLARMDHLGLFSNEHRDMDWNGPEQRPTRRNETRFNDWMTVDIGEHPQVDES